MVEKIVAGRKYYTTRKEIEKHRKKGGIVYYDPIIKGYYTIKIIKRKSIKKRKSSFWDRLFGK